MAKKAAEYPIGRGGRASLPDYADYWVVTAGNKGLLTSQPFRLAGVEYQSFTTSDAGTVVVKIFDGSASTGTLVVPSTNRTINVFYSYPFIRLEHGVFVDLSVSVSVTGAKALIFGVIDEE